MEEQEPQRADYGGNGEPSMPQGQTGGLKALIPTLLISAVVCVGILVSGIAPSAYVTKNDLTTNMNAMGTSIEGVRSSITEAQGKAAQAVQDVTALKSSVTGYAKQSDLAALQAQVANLPKPGDTSGLSSQISTLQSKVETLTTQVNNDKTLITQLQTQVATLQNGTGTNGGGTTTGLVTTSIVTNSNILTSFTTTNSTTAVSYSIPFKIKIVNGLNKEIQNLQLYTQLLGYSTSGAFPSGTGSLTSSSGGVWSTYATSGTSWYFTNANTMSWAGSGLTVPANTTKTLTLIFTYRVDPNQEPSTIQFTPDVAAVSVGDYEIP